MGPAAMPQLRAVVLDFNATSQRGRDIHLAFTVDLGLAPLYFADKSDKPMATLRDALSAASRTGHEFRCRRTHRPRQPQLVVDRNPARLEVRRRDGT